MVENKERTAPETLVRHHTSYIVQCRTQYSSGPQRSAAGDASVTLDVLKCLKLCSLD